MISQIHERIAVLLGGPSNEKDISTKSGNTVYEALCSRGLDTVRIDISDDPIAQIRQAKADVAFIALHGRFGEDGTIQAMLDKENIPYTGSGPKASALAMDKIASRKIFQQAGLPVPQYTTANSREGLQLPVVVKPNREGSSIGMSIVNNEKNLDDAIKKALSYDDDIIIERFIEGDDITVGILNDKPLPVVHIKPKSGIYDFESKYTEGMTEYIVPAQFEKNLRAHAREIGLKAHSLLGCHCFSRVDMRLDKDNKIYVLEVNTIPGLTSTSLLPKAAGAVGIDFPQMCIDMIKSTRLAVKHG